MTNGGEATETLRLTSLSFRSLNAVAAVTTYFTRIRITQVAWKTRGCCSEAVLHQVLQGHLPRRGWFGWQLPTFTRISSKELEGGVNRSPDTFHRRELPGPACLASAVSYMGQQRHQRSVPGRAHRNPDEMACGNSAPPMEPRMDACGWKHLCLRWAQRR